MSPSATPDSPPPPLKISENADNHLQPFFVLHRALRQKPLRKSSTSGKTRRKVDFPPASPKPSEKANADCYSVEDDHQLYEKLRMEAFCLVWSKIENAVKGVLRQINLNVFNEINRWVCESFDAIRASTTHGFSEVQRWYPPAADCVCKQIFTALILTKNIEFVDDLLTFEELGVHLKSYGCHVANLSSVDFSVKNGIGGCLRSLLRQLVVVTSDAADISILAAWYNELENCDHPVVIIIDDMEQCNGTILAEFIMLLSEWITQIPIILIIGVATTIDATMKVLPSNALQCLQPCKFMLSSPAERLDAIIEDVLVKHYFGFGVGHEAAVFLRNYFLKHDGTVTSFIRALKIACIKHFSTEPLSFLGHAEIDGDSEVLWKKKCQLLPELMLKYAFNLPSCQREEFTATTGETLASGLSELKSLQRNWSSVVMCIYEVGKFHKMQLLDIFCEALSPDFCNSRATDYFLGGGKDFAMSLSVDRIQHAGERSGFTRGTFIVQALRKVRDLPIGSLSPLLKIWANHTEEMLEINHKVEELQSALKFEDAGKNLKQKWLDSRERSTSRCRSAVEKGTSSVQEKAAVLLECMIRDCMKPVELKPFHEIICFKNVGILQSALIGDPRRTIQLDLLKSHAYLQCGCCNKGGSLLPSMHDTSTMYNLAQEHGDLINLHDWYQSFRATVLNSNAKSKHKKQQSPMSKKRKATHVAVEVDEASIQARFCRAVIELQITGLLRMPSKRRPDYVQRVAFGL